CGEAATGVDTRLRRRMPIQLNPRLPVISAPFVGGLGGPHKFLTDSAVGVSYARCAACALRDRCEELVAQAIVQREMVRDLPRVLKPAGALIAIDSSSP